jgi:hypothetical protein
LVKGNYDTKVRTFRLSSSLDTVLNEDAKRQSITTSALLGQIVARYAAAERYFIRYEPLTLEKNTFISLINEVSDDKVAKLGELAGSRSLRDGLAVRSMEVNSENVRFIVEEIYGIYSGWFKSNFFKRDGDSVYHLKHDLGNKWSIFIEQYMIKMFKTVLKLEAKSERYIDSVTIYLPK